MANLLAIDVREHNIQDNQVGPVFLDHHAGVEAGIGHANLKAPVLFKDLGHQLDQFRVVIDEQDLALPAFERVGWDAIVLHELVQGFAGNAAKPGTRYAKPFQLSVVEAANDCLLADLADFGRLTGRKNGLHGFVHPLTGPSCLRFAGSQRFW